MDEVSGRFAKWVYDSGLADGVPEAELTSGVEVGPDVLASGRERISWDDYVQMLENYHAAVGLEGMREAAYAFGTTQGLESFGKMAGIFFSPRRIYHLMYRWVGNHFLRNVRFEIADHEDGSVRITSHIDEGYRGSEVFFLTLTNVLAGTPLRIGCDPAEVDFVSRDDRHAEYRVVLPKARVGVGRLLGWPKRLLESRVSSHEVGLRQQEEIRASQVAMERQRKDFATMIESLVDPLFIIGPAGETLFVNETARSLFVVPISPGDWRPEDALERGAADAWREFVDGSAGEGKDFAFRRSDVGKLVQLEFGAPQAVSFDGQEAKLLVGRDVTEQRQAERKEREAALAERRRLAAEIHDGLAQQLMVIAMRIEGLAGRIASGEGEDGHVARAEAIAEATREAIRVARDLGHGLWAVDEEEDNLRRGLERHVEELREVSQFGIALDLPADRQLSGPGQLVLEILRIVQESCSNALKHSKGENLRISLEVGAAGWLLAVADDGIGMPDGEGSSGGLGMSTLKVRAGQLGGTVDVGRRRDGKPGAEVVVSLPPDWAEREPQEIVADTAPIESLPGMKPIRLMVADDQEIVLDGLSAMLERQPDFEICACVSEKREILPTALEVEPDVLLTDMMMGASDNLPVIAKLRQEQPATGIVALSMLHEEFYAADTLAAGADAYVMKLSPTKHLVDVIREVARKDRGGSPVEGVA